MRLLVIALGSFVLLTATDARAQAPTRWKLSWTDDSYRYVNGERVPVGPQTAVLTVTPTRGDSVQATWPTANPAIVDTLEGTMSATRIVLQSRVTTVTARRPGSAPDAQISARLRLELDLSGDRGVGTSQRELAGPPGVTIPPLPPTPVLAERLP